MIFFSGTPNMEEELKKHDIEELESCCDELGLVGAQREEFIKNSLKNMNKPAYEDYTKEG